MSELGGSNPVRQGNVLRSRRARNESFGSAFCSIIACMKLYIS